MRFGLKLINSFIMALHDLAYLWRDVDCLCSQRVLVLVATDVDALCACKILQVSNYIYI